MAEGTTARLRKAADNAATVCAHSPESAFGRAAFYELLAATYEHLVAEELRGEAMAAGLLTVHDGKLARAGTG